MADLAEVVRLAVARRKRHILKNLRKARVGAATILAALIEGQNTETLIAEAARRFCSVSWGLLKDHSGIFLPTTILAHARLANDDLRELATHCELACCDAFISHSTIDHASLKWKVVKRWCEEFCVERRRAPTLWLDKICIDQAELDADLQCLPIFLAGCNRFLVLAGATYVSRLWTVLELFIYISMQAPDDCHEEGVIVLPLVRDDVALYELRTSWNNFDASETECFTPFDKTRILRLIAQSSGGISQFNTKVADLLRILAPDDLRVSQEPSVASDRVIRLSSQPPTQVQGDEERRHILMEARDFGGEIGALHLHTMLHPYYWGISQAQFRDFMRLVEEGVARGSIVNFTVAHLPQYSVERFQSVGPNAYQVCDQLIKPVSGRDAVRLPFASYALQQNHEMGLACSLFISHAWAEGLFELSDTLGDAWPIECEGAYLCFLANPQNLDISALVQRPDASPFYRILACRPRVMVMAANSTCPIHERLWCCLEAFCAVNFDIPVEIGGDPLWLAPARERPRARAVLELAVCAQRAANKASEDGVRGVIIMKEAMKRLRTCFEEIAISIDEAACYCPHDRKLILELIGDRAPAVNAMIKQQMVDKSNEAAGNMSDVFYSSNMSGSKSCHIIFNLWGRTATGRTAAYRQTTCQICICYLMYLIYV
jgi:hypothetical protein